MGKKNPLESLLARVRAQVTGEAQLAAWEEDLGRLEMRCYGMDECGERVEFSIPVPVPAAMQTRLAEIGEAPPMKQGFTDSEQLAAMWRWIAEIVATCEWSKRVRAWHDADPATRGRFESLPGREMQGWDELIEIELSRLPANLLAAYARGVGRLVAEIEKKNLGLLVESRLADAATSAPPPQD